MPNKTKTILTPILLALAVILGMFINSLLDSKRGAEASKTLAYSTNSKIDVIMSMINHSYVDSVDIRKIEEDAIPALLQNLDPHTVYIPAKKLKEVNEGIVGNFGGVGIQFYQLRDTITVVNTVIGGPAEDAGILPGDRIVAVDDSIIAGRNLSTDGIMKLLRGKVGSHLKLTIFRRTLGKKINKDITRGTIPIKSVDIAYMANDTTGVIKINTFGMNTYKEFMASMEELKSQGMKKLIIDLEGNPGGVMVIAINIINEFLGPNKLIVYTQGKASRRMEYRSNGKGQYQDLPLTILIDESSASASEIFSGAMQDNDRALIVGRRSFGKGLVQEQRQLSDGSAIRLTIARYYIPSGRSIQKSYKNGNNNYYEEVYKRYTDGEMLQRDSIHLSDTLKYHTSKGRVVYGGGGIIPDKFVAIDTSDASMYWANLNGRLDKKQYLYEYTFDFMDKHRSEMKNIKDYKALEKYLSQFNLVDSLVAYASKRGVKKDTDGLRRSRGLIRNSIEAFIGRHLLDDMGFYPIHYKYNPIMQRALKEPSMK